VEKKAFTYMAGTPEDIARKFEEQALVQKMHHEMLQAQQKAINDHKVMVALLLDKSKKKSKSTGSPSKPGASSSSKPSKNKGKGSEGEHSTSENPGGEDNYEDKHVESSSEEQESSSHVGDPHSKRIDEFE